MQVLAYGIVDASYRFVAQGNVPLAVSSGMLYAIVAFAVIKKVAAEPTSNAALWGYVTGGGLGTWLGILVSKFITGQ